MKKIKSPRKFRLNIKRNLWRLLKRKEKIEPLKNVAIWSLEIERF